MKVSIIGHGFVGKALENGINDNVSTQIIDPKYNNSISDVAQFNPKIIFICVPTPMNNDGTQDLDILRKVIKEIHNMQLAAKVVIKSTVLPSEILDFQNLIPGILFNPEFLTEKNANEDFINGDLIVIGGDSENRFLISEFYQKNTECISKDHILTDLISASLIKYTINSFLASKVIFFNQIHSLFNHSGTKESWEYFILALSKDTRIGNSHMQVPGPDGRYGFGGACFPKDSLALYKYSESLNTPLEILKKVIDTNNDIRNSYDTLIDRENDQNIDFQPKK